MVAPPHAHVAKGLCIYYWTRYRWLFWGILVGMCVLSAGAQALRLLGYHAEVPAMNLDAIAQASNVQPSNVVFLAAGMATMFGMVAFSAPFGMPDPCTFGLPVRTSVLTAWRLFGAMGTAAAGWTALASLLWRPLGIEAPVLWPAAEFAAITLFGHATNVNVAMRPNGTARFPSVTVFAVTLILVSAGPAAAFLQVPSTVILFGYLGVGAGTYPVALNLIRRARCGLVTGETVAAPAPRERRPAIRVPFSSAGRAQEWTEWQRFGREIPRIAFCLSLFVAIFLRLVITGMRYFAPPGDVSPDAGSMFGPSAVLMLCPFIGSFTIYFRYMRYTIQSTVDQSQELFSFVRPLTTGDIVASRFRAAARSVGMLCVAVVPALTVCFLTAGRSWNEDCESLRAVLYGSAHHPIDVRGVILVLTIAAIFAITAWRNLAEWLCITMLGRTRLTTALVVAQFAVPFFFVAGMAFLGANQHLSHWTVAHTKLFLQIAAAAKLVAAVTILGVLGRRKLVRFRSLIWLSAGWLSLYAILLAMFAVIVHHSLWIAPVVAPALVLFLPAVRVSLAPLALERNRHR
jgi:hypothetical protein